MWFQWRYGTLDHAIGPVSAHLCDNSIRDSAATNKLKLRRYVFEAPHLKPSAPSSFKEPTSCPCHTNDPMIG